MTKEIVVNTLTRVEASGPKFAVLNHIVPTLFYPGHQIERNLQSHGLTIVGRIKLKLKINGYI